MPTLDRVCDLYVTRKRIAVAASDTAEATKRTFAAVVSVWAVSMSLRAFAGHWCPSGPHLPASVEASCDCDMPVTRATANDAIVTLPVTMTTGEMCIEDDASVTTISATAAGRRSAS